MNTLHSQKTRRSYWLGLSIWLIGGCLIRLFGDHLSLANIGLLLVLTTTVASLWLRFSLSFFCSLIALMAFDWSLVPPVGAFTIDFHQDLILLLVMLLVNGIIAGLVSRLRDQSEKSQLHAAASENLRNWVERLRDAEQPEDLLEDLHRQLSSLAGVDIGLVVENRACGLVANDEQRQALMHCWKAGQALGANTGRYQELGAVYLPLRGRQLTLGAVLIAGCISHNVLIEARALCDQMALALERNHIQKQEQLAREQVQAQQLKNTFLAAISHDYRTPLATILSAASAIQQQDLNLNSPQRKELTQNIIEEVERLGRLTSNILQLARLDSTDEQLQANWESVEDIVGNVLRRMRQQDSNRRIQVELQKNLPLLWGDPLLLSQLLENLLDNALRYTAEGLITLKAYLDAEVIILAVEDQGAGIPEAEISRLFAVFQRGDHSGGAGVGLAFCRAVAQAHQGELNVYSSAEGSRFECCIPIKPQPEFPG
ncbi:MAG TPA: ATP-binding protein [Cellvibrio sp.]|nr:ATP-binding protein [Cellvibrio sp.]